MKSVRFILLIGVLALLPMLNSGGEAQISDPAEPNDTSATVGAAVSYQGLLTDPSSGAPLTGAFDLEFTFWSAVTGGSQVGWSITRTGQLITKGLYSTRLAVDASQVHGQELWLRIRVRESGTATWETLSPRLEVLPTMYAMTLRPGARIHGDVAAPYGIVRAINTGTGMGLFGHSENGAGVQGYSHYYIGVRGDTSGGTSNDYGVYGTADGSAYGVHGYQSNTSSGLAVYGKNEGGGSGVSGYNLDDGNGTWGYSADYRGVAGGTGRVDNNYGLYTIDNLYSANYHLSGAVMQVVQNGGSEVLERGDVVVIVGISRSSAEWEAPTILVRKASGSNSTGVLGVVASTYSEAWLEVETDPTGASAGGKEIPATMPGPIRPDEYLLIVVQGPALVKVDAAAGVIEPGDLLTSAGQTGYAGKAAEVTIEGVRTAAPGTVFGKALEPLDSGQELIYVFVTLQ